MKMRLFIQRSRLLILNGSDLSTSFHIVVIGQLRELTHLNRLWGGIECSGTAWEPSMEWGLNNQHLTLLESPHCDVFQVDNV